MLLPVVLSNKNAEKLLRYFSEFKRNCSKLDLIELTEDWNEQQPKLPEGEKLKINLSPEALLMVEALEKAKEQPIPEPQKPDLVGPWGNNFKDVPKIEWDDE